MVLDHPGVYASVGIHPNEADRSSSRGLGANPQPRRVGPEWWPSARRDWIDIGIEHPFDVQRDYFDRHLGLAERHGLPVIIHSRDCHADIVERLRRRGRPIRGVLHSFTGSWSEAEQLLDLGLNLSFAGMVTFQNKSIEPLRLAATKVPLDRLLVETDSPYLSPHPHRGRQNEPSRVSITAATLAELRGMPLVEFAEATTRNARQLFSIPDRPHISES